MQVGDYTRMWALVGYLVREQQVQLALRCLGPSSQIHLCSFWLLPAMTRGTDGQLLHVPSLIDWAPYNQNNVSMPALTRLPLPRLPDPLPDIVMVLVVSRWARRN